MHAHAAPEDPTRERTKSAFELDITAEALKACDLMTGEEETTALLADADESRDRDIDAGTGAVRLDINRHLTTWSTMQAREAALA